MKLFFFAFLLLIAGFASAGNFNFLAYQSNGSYVDMFNNGLNTTAWIENQTLATFQIGMSPFTGFPAINYTTKTTCSSEQGNFTLTNNLKRNTDVNVSWFSSRGSGGLVNIDLRLTNGFPGNLYRSLNNNSAFTASPENLFFNSSNNSVTYYNGANGTSTTFNVSAFNQLYLSTYVQCGSAGNTVNVQFFKFMNVSVAPNFTSLIYNPLFLFYNNGTQANSLNLSTLSTQNALSGTVTFSLHRKNFWNNFTLTNVNASLNYSLYFDEWATIQNSTLFFQVLDQTTLQQINFSVSFENSTFGTSYQNYSRTFWSNWSGLPSGTITISLQNYSYANYYYSQGRNFFFNGYPTALSPSYQNLTFYMLPQSVTTGSVIISVVNNAGSRVQGATVQLYRTLNGVSTLVDQGVTSSDGTAGFFVDKIVQYTLIVSASGYDTSTSTTTFFGDSYTVVLGTPGQSNYSGFYYNMSVVFNPQQSYLNVNYTDHLDFNVTLNNTNCALTNYTFSIRNTTTVMATQTSTQSCGGFLNYTLNTTPFVLAGVTAETYNVTLVIYINGFPAQIISQFYVVQFSLPTGVEAGLRKIALVSTPWWNTIIAILASLLLTLFFAKYLGFGSGIITLMSLGIFAYYGMIDGGIFMVATLVLAALLIGGRYILS